MWKNEKSFLKFFGIPFICTGSGLSVLGLILFPIVMPLWWTALIPFGIGMIFLIAGGICWSIYKTRQSKKNDLLSKSDFVMAEVEDIDIDFHQRVKIDRIDMNPYYIVCRYVDSNGKEYRFRSKSLLYNPSGLMKNNQIKVYVDLENPKKYYVDTNEILPENAILHKFKFDSKRNANELLQGGKYIQAQTCGVELLGIIKVRGVFKPELSEVVKSIAKRFHMGTDEKGRSFMGYSILCRYDAPDGTIHIFASRGMWGEPERDYIGDIVRVYYKGKGYKRYHVDVNSIL